MTEYIGYAVSAYNTLKAIADFLDKQQKIHMKRAIYAGDCIKFKSYRTIFQAGNDNFAMVKEYCSSYPTNDERAKRDAFDDINRFEEVEIRFGNTGDIASNMYTHFKQDSEVFQADLLNDLKELFKTYENRARIQVKKYFIRDTISACAFGASHIKYYKLLYTIEV